MCSRLSRDIGLNQIFPHALENPHFVAIRNFQHVKIEKKSRIDTDTGEVYSPVQTLSSGKSNKSDKYFEQNLAFLKLLLKYEELKDITPSYALHLVLSLSRGGGGGGGGVG